MNNLNKYYYSKNKCKRLLQYVTLENNISVILIMIFAKQYVSNYKKEANIFRKK